MKSVFRNWFKTTTLLLSILVLASVASSQTTTPTTTPTPTPTPVTIPLFATGTTVTALHLAGTTNPATDLYGQYHLTNNIVLRTDSLLAPGNNFQGYYGGVGWAGSPDALFTKTNLPKNTFQVYGFGDVGVARNVPASGPTLQKFSFWLHGGLNYDPLGSGKFTVNVVDVGWINAPGFSSPNSAGTLVSSPNGWTVSIGIKLGFGSSN